jgi:hypothetical protein
MAQLKPSHPLAAYEINHCARAQRIGFGIAKGIEPSAVVFK